MAGGALPGGGEVQLQNQGVPSTVYYRGSGVQKPPVNTVPVTASGSGTFQQSGSAAFSLAGHPGVWLVAGVVACFLILHKAGLDA
jgi:hypothetical protein